MEKIFSFVAEYSSLLSFIITVLVGYYVSKLESEVSNLSDFVQEQLRDGQIDCKGCRKEIDRVLGEAGKSLMELKGKTELFDEKLGNIQQAFYETQAIVTTKKEIMTKLADLRLEVEALKKDNDNLAHRLSLVEIDI
jgi:hypothetical protein